MVNSRGFHGKIRVKSLEIPISHPQVSVHTLFMSISGGLTWMDATLALAQISASVFHEKLDGERNSDGINVGIYIWDVNGIYMGFKWDLDGVYMGFRWDLDGIEMGFKWDLNGSTW